MLRAANVPKEAELSRSKGMKVVGLAKCGVQSTKTQILLALGFCGMLEALTTPAQMMAECFGESHSNAQKGGGHLCTIKF